MNFTYFLEKDNRIKFGLLNRLASEAGNAILTDSLYEEVEISDYKLEQTITDINDDLSIIDPSKHTFIDFSDKTIIRGINITTSTIQKASLLYIKDSISFIVLQYLFFFDNQMTKNDYRNQNYISKTTFYKAESYVRKTLKETDFYEDLKITKDREFAIRLQLFQLYYQIYNGLENPFPEIDPVIDHIIGHIQSSFKINLKPTQITKVSIFTRILLLRINNDNLITDSLLQNGLHYPYLNEFNLLAKQDLKATLSVEEIDYLYSFLLAEGIVPGASDYLSSAVTPRAIELTDEFMKIIENAHIFVDSVSNETSSLIRQTIFNLNLQFFTFYHEPTTFISLSQASFFKQTYPLFDTVINDFFTLINKEIDLKLTQNDRINLYFSLMFALITTVPSKDLLDKVYICVDFSQGELYSNYIKETLHSFSNAHIIIQDEVNERTNIYLSDFQSNFLEVEQIIWQNPPSPNDWTLLGDEIIKAKQANIDATK